MGKGKQRWRNGDITDVQTVCSGSTKSVRFIFEHAAWSGLVGVSVVSWRGQNGEDINV